MSKLRYPWDILIGPIKRLSWFLTMFRIYKILFSKQILIVYKHALVLSKIQGINWWLLNKSKKIIRYSYDIMLGAETTMPQRFGATVVCQLARWPLDLIPRLQKRGRHKGQLPEEKVRAGQLEKDGFEKIASTCKEHVVF